MEVIVFGTGSVAQKAYSFMNENYEVLWYVDSDSKKWGGKIGDYDIKNPISVLDNSANIIVVSMNYEMEMIQQLIDMKVDNSRIYLCNQEESEGNFVFDIYPYDKDRLVVINKKLINYDLKKRNEYETKRIKVMIFASFYSVYTKQLIENTIYKYKDIEISLITYARQSEYLIDSEKIQHIYVFESMAELQDILLQIPHYNVAQLLWIENKWAYFRDLIRKKFNRINLCVGGSDFYRVSNCDRDYKKKLIYSADCVSAETEGTIQEFKNYYGNTLDVKLLPFGVEVLKYIKVNSGRSKDELKNKFNIPINKIVVTCGHNANTNHQHLKLIDEINELNDDIKGKVVFIFPMTYPGGMDTYICKVREKLEKSNLNYVILTEFMDFQGMAEYALISDIMIHVQTTDQLSSTMLEEMYAGSIVIAGSWLPYKSLHEKGMYFIDVNKIEEVSNILVNVIDNIDEYIEKCKVNKELVCNHSSWDILSKKWHELWV